VAFRLRWRRRRDDAFPINHPAAFARDRWYGPPQHHGRGASRSGASRRNRVDQPRFPTGPPRRMDPRRQLPLPSGLGSKAPRGYADRPQRRHPRHGWRLHTRRVLVRLAVSSKASSALGTCGKSRRLVERPVRRSSASPQRAIRLGAQRGESRACKRPPRSHPPRVAVTDSRTAAALPQAFPPGYTDLVERRASHQITSATPTELMRAATHHSSVTAPAVIATAWTNAARTTVSKNLRHHIGG
jgi:hypothetical protein